MGPISPNTLQSTQTSDAIFSRQHVSTAAPIDLKLWNFSICKCKNIFPRTFLPRTSDLFFGAFLTLLTPCSNRKPRTRVACNVVFCHTPIESCTRSGDMNFHNTRVCPKTGNAQECDETQRYYEER